MKQTLFAVLSLCPGIYFGATQWHQVSNSANCPYFEYVPNWNGSNNIYANSGTCPSDTEDEAILCTLDHAGQHALCSVWVAGTSYASLDCSCGLEGASGCELFTP